MRVSRISIKNILGIEALEIEPGHLVEISGANGTGKTSILDAIRAALSGGTDATLLRQGATEGEVVLILEDGVQIERRITADKSDTVVRHPTFGKISKPAQYLKKLADALSLNPVEFLTAPAKDRVNILLEAIPMTVTADQLREIPAIALTGIDLDKHALTVIGQIGRSLYDLRTGVNRAAKEKAATAKQMTETLPAEAPEGDWKDQLEALTIAFRELQRCTQSAVSACKQRHGLDVDRAKAAFAAQKEAIQKEAERDIEKIRADAEIAIADAENRRNNNVDVIQKEMEAELSTMESEYKPRNAELNEKIGQARTMIEANTKAETTRTFIGQLNEEAGKLDAEASKLTHALGRLEILKSNLLEKLPIDGLEVRDGDIYLGGLPFDRVNESKRIRLAIEIAKLRAGSLGLVAVDGLERLDPKTFATFKKEAAKSGLQFVISHVTDGPLAIETEVA
jgi:energy-coupling factor transporter ATP-binding protein EcfA2